MDPPNEAAVPPAELKSLIDKTAGFVLKNGAAFEDRLRKDPKSAEKFPFIFSDHQFYHYYQWKLGKASQEAEGTANGTAEGGAPPTPPALEFLMDLPQISGLDLQVIRTTALFTAVNGREYARRLQAHETSRGHKAQFDFLNKQSTLHQLFTAYVAQYEKTIEHLNRPTPPPDLVRDAYARAVHDKYHKVQKVEHSKAVKQRDMEYAAIDWQDFALVGTIEFSAVDEVTELAVPLEREDLVYRSLEAKTREIDLVMAPKVESVEVSAPEPKSLKGIKIKAAGESRLKKRAKERLIRCPLTEQLIPESKFDEHLRVLLRDPRYTEQKENHLRKNFKYASNLTTDEVYENMKRLSRKRALEEEQQSQKRLK